MKNFKFTTKTALIIVLVLISIAGIYLYTKTSRVNKNTSATDNKGFLSFFGERKIKPEDETVVPGANVSNTTGSSDALGENTAGVDNLGASGSGDNRANGGSLSLKPISTNVNNNGNITNLSGGTGSANGGSGIGGNSGRGSGSGSASGTGFGGGTGSGGGTTGGPVEQINCTPKEIEFTEEEKAKLKELEARFYKVAAEIRTQQDVDTLVRTRQNYYNYLSSDYSVNSKKDGTGVIELTKQCFQERKNVADGAPGFKDKPIGMRPNPYITKDMFNTIAAVPPLRSYLNNERLSLKNQIEKLTKEIKDTEPKIPPLENSLESLNNNYDDLECPNKPRCADIKKEINEKTQILNRYVSTVNNNKESINKLKVLLDQATNDPFSYFANSTTYIEKEPFSEKETDLSRKNAIYQNVQGIFNDVFGWGDIMDKLWGAYKWENAPQSNPLKAAGFADPCNKDSEIARGVRRDPDTSTLKCYERYYPMQNLERILGIW